jgi:hypothetical protein
MGGVCHKWKIYEDTKGKGNVRVLEDPGSRQSKGREVKFTNGRGGACKGE